MLDILHEPPSTLAQRLIGCISEFLTGYGGCRSAGGISVLRVSFAEDVAMAEQGGALDAASSDDGGDTPRTGDSAESQSFRCAICLVRPPPTYDQILWKPVHMSDPNSNRIGSVTQARIFLRFISFLRFTFFNVFPRAAHVLHTVAPSFPTRAYAQNYVVLRFLRIF